MGQQLQYGLPLLHCSENRSLSRPQRKTQLRRRCGLEADRKTIIVCWIDKVCCYNTRANQQDMTGGRITISVIVSCQNYEVGSRTRIGMRRQTGDTIVCATIICCTITEIPPVVIVEATSSIENSRTARSDSRIRHKINPRRRLNKHKMAGHSTSPTSIRNSQDNSKGATGRESVSHSTPSRC